MAASRFAPKFLLVALVLAVGGVLLVVLFRTTPQPGAHPCRQCKFNFNNGRLRGPTESLPVECTNSIKGTKTLKEKYTISNFIAVPTSGPQKGERFAFPPKSYGPEQNVDLTLGPPAKPSTWNQSANLIVTDQTGHECVIEMPIE